MFLLKKNKQYTSIEQLDSETHDPASKTFDPTMPRNRPY